MRALIVLTIVLFSSFAFAQERLSILQGATSDTVTHLTIVAPKGLTFGFEVKGRGRSVEPTKHEIKEQPGSDWVVHRLRYEDLELGALYELRVIDAQSKVWDYRQFKTLDINKQDGSIGLASCMLDLLHNPIMWETMADKANRPDVFFFNGDSAYLDRAHLLKKELPTSRLQMWDRWIQTRQTIDFYYWERLTPVFSNWDDHDSGGDNVDSTFYLMKDARELFEIMFANEEIPGFLEAGPGISYQLNLFGKNILMADGRSFRVDEGASHNMFGKTQEAWLLDHIRKGSNIIVSGSQFFGGGLNKDSYEHNWPEDFKRFKQLLRERLQAKGGLIGFFSGDIHFSEILEMDASEFGYPVYEVTSSSVHSFPFLGHQILTEYNPRRIASTGTHNMLLITFKPVSNELVMDVRAVTWRNAEPFEKYLVTNGVWNSKRVAGGPVCQATLEGSLAN